MMPQPEFSRPFPLDTLGPAPRRVSIEAAEAEREALARRFGLVAIHGLAAEAELKRDGDSVTATGTLRAAVTQSCVASAEPIETSVEAPFRIEFRPAPAAASDEEVELKAAELDVVFHDGAAIDLGDAVAETLPLSLDPYPRSPAADEALRAAGVKREEQEAKAEESPFAALAALKDKLEK
jgi:uncharacterized metal-binding protein YceD (DUF177 family)